MGDVGVRLLTEETRGERKRQRVHVLQGCREATTSCGRDVFDGGTRRQLVQSLLLDYLGLSKEGRETRTLCEIYPEYFIVQPEPGGEGAFVTLRDDAYVADDEEEATMEEIRRVIDEYEQEEAGAGNADVPEVVRAAAGLAAPSNPAAADRLVRRREDDRQKRQADAILWQAKDEALRPRADGAPNRRNRPR